MIQGTITRRMKSTRKDIYRNLLTKRDFETMLSVLRGAADSQRPSICARLCEMFSAMGIKCEPGKNNAYYENLVSNSNLPDFEDVEKSILKTMFQCFCCYPTPEDYMRRIVDRLSDDTEETGRNASESLRLRILKQFVSKLNCGVYTLADGKKRSVFKWEKVIEAYAKKKGAPKCKNSSEAASYLDEGIFIEYYELMEQYQDKIHQFQQEDQVLRCREEARKWKSAEKKWKKAEEKAKKDSRFPRPDPKEWDMIQLNLEKANSALKEEEKPIERAKSRLKDFRAKYDLVKLSDDLSKGVFRKDGITKRDLYLFAIAFDMTYSICKDDSPMQTTMLVDYRTDIEKNLFEDYYTNNLMRFITDAYVDGEQSSIEIDPSGMGINYKNFAEMVYIYFISKDYEPLEKFRLATEMIERLENTEKKVFHDAYSTQYYQEVFTDTILSQSEQEFEHFISENYDCSVDFVNGRKSPKHNKGIKAELQLRNENETGFNYYRTLLQKITSGEGGVQPVPAENCNYGLWYVDVSAFKKVGTSDLEMTMEEIRKETAPEQQGSKTVKQFIDLLYGINMFLGQSFAESESELGKNQEHTEISKRIIKKMAIKNAEDMTRTALIVAYYYRYNQLNELYGSDKSFVDVMDDYLDPVSGLNAMLEASGYQSMNDRNLFDLAVMFSSYAYLSM